jgi:Domain of unknown function (DUF4276)
MIRVNVICEGQTEYDFVDKLLYPYFILRGILLTATDIGGANNYTKIRREIITWLNGEHGAYLTTMIDLYGMNKHFPGYEANSLLNCSSIQKVEAIEAAIKKDILDEPRVHNHKFIPYIQLHEFEALLFSEPKTLQEWLSLDHRIRDNSFSDIRAAFDTPEDINDSPHTAPSKRILAIVEAYDKVAEGVLIASEIGLPKLRNECPHFNAWLVNYTLP